MEENYMQIVPMRDLKNTVEIERKCSESGEPVYVTKNGYGRLVVMDIDVYERTIRDMYEAKLVHEALEEIKNGAKCVDGETLYKEIMTRYAK